MKIVLPRGIKIGHAQTAYTGVTVVLCENGAVCGCDVRGGAPGTRETDLLKSEKMMDKVNAVMLAGGSAYGLAAADGVMRYLMQKGCGYKVGSKVVPIVPSAVIFDLNDKEYHFPTAEMGLEACKSATSTPSFGNVGVGTGATVGKLRGLKNACKGGIGAATVKIAGVNVTAIAAVNAFGDVVNPDTGAIIAGARGKNGFIDTEKTLAEGDLGRALFGSNTTIGCIITDGKLSKVQANKLASIAHNGYARAIRPVHTDYDGDTMFCLSAGVKPVINLALLQAAAVRATEQAIVNAVTSEPVECVEDDGECGEE